MYKKRWAAFISAISSTYKNYSDHDVDKALEKVVDQNSLGKLISQVQWHASEEHGGQIAFTKQKLESIGQSVER